MATCLVQGNAVPRPPGVAGETGERQELNSWLEYARYDRAPASFQRRHFGQRFCRLPFNLAQQDRFGQQQVQMVRSHTVGDRAAVLFSRRKMPLFNVVWIQLDDGTNRAWVRAKVTENISTIGGQLVRVEYLAPPGASS